MTTRNVNIEDLGAAYRIGHEQMVDATHKAILKAALIGESVVAADTPVDTGLTRNQWQVIPTNDGAELVNDSPVAGIVEAGSRPHRPPYQPILEWVVRKFGTGQKSFSDWNEVDSYLHGIARAIVRKIEAEGTKPNYMVKKNLDRLAEIAKREVEAELGRIA